MKLNDLQTQYESKISRINRWLEETYGFKVFDQVEVEKLYQVKSELDAQREQLKQSLPFNSYHQHPEYAKNILLSEAIVLMIGQVPDEMVDQIKKKDNDDCGCGETPCSCGNAHGDESPISGDEEMGESTAVVKENEDLEKAETVLASQQLVDEFQGMIEDLGKMQNETLGAIVDKMTYEFGADAASQFNTAMNDTLSAMLDSARQAKEQAQNEVLKIQGEQPASTMDTDDATDDVDDLDLDGQDSLELDSPDSDQKTAGDDSASGPVDEPLGRAKKS